MNDAIKIVTEVKDGVARETVQVTETAQPDIQIDKFNNDFVEYWVEPQFVITGATQTVQDRGPLMVLNDAASESCAITFYCPLNKKLVGAWVVWTTPADCTSGKVAKFYVDFGTAPEGSTWAPSPIQKEYTVKVTKAAGTIYKTPILNRAIVGASFDNLVSGGTFGGLNFYRYGGDAEDTISNDVYIRGFLLRFV